MTNLHDARVAAAAEAIANTHNEGHFETYREGWVEEARAALAAADAVVTVEMIAEVILKSLVFTDATSMAWANGVARNVLALIRGGGEQ